MASAIRSTRISWPRWRRCRRPRGCALGFDRLVMLATGAQPHRAGALDAGGRCRSDQRRHDSTAPPKTHADAPSTDLAACRPGRAPTRRRARRRSRARYAVAITPAMAALIDRADPPTRSRGSSCPTPGELRPRARGARRSRSATTRTARSTGIVHRYPDRVLLKVDARLRRSIAGSASAARWSGRAAARRCRRRALDAALAYIARATRDLGGDRHRRRSAGAVAAPLARDRATRLAAIAAREVMRWHTPRAGGRPRSA